MLNENGVLTHYLLCFLFYTLSVVGLIYGVARWYARRHLSAATPAAAPAKEESPPPVAAPPPLKDLSIESSLPLEAGKMLHIVRAGSEKFFIASSEQDVYLLSKLETKSNKSDDKAKNASALAWFSPELVPPP